MAQGSTPIQVGTICITRGSKVPLLNNGILVKVVGINPPWMGGLKVSQPYMIERADRRKLGLVGSKFYTCTRATIEAWRLIPIAPPAGAATTARPRSASVPTREIAA